MCLEMLMAEDSALQAVDPLLVGCVRDVLLYGTTLLASTRLSLDLDKALTLVSQAKYEHLSVIDGNAVWKIAGHSLLLDRDHHTLAVTCAIANRFRHSSDYVFPSSGGRPISASSARKKVLRTKNLLIAYDGEACMCGISRSPCLEDAEVLFTLKGGDPANLATFRDAVNQAYEDRVASEAAPVEEAEDDMAALIAGAPEHPTKVRTAVFGGHTKFVQRKYAPALGLYGIEMTKHYPWGARGKKDISLPKDTDLILIMKDMTGHSGTTGSTVAMELARKTGIQWAAVPRKISHALTTLRSMGILPAAPVLKLVAPTKEEVEMAKPEIRPLRAVARAEAWTEWRARRLEFLRSDLRSVGFEYEGAPYKVNLCPAFKEDGQMVVGHGDTIIGEFSDPNGVLVQKNSHNKRLVIRAKEVWERREVETDLAAYLATLAGGALNTHPEPVMEVVAAPVALALAPEETLPTPQAPVVMVAMTPLTTTPAAHRTHPYEDFADLVTMMEDAMVRLGYDTVTLGRDGSLVITRKPR